MLRRRRRWCRRRCRRPSWRRRGRCLGVVTVSWVDLLWGGGGKRGGNWGKEPRKTSLTPPNANPAAMPARKASRAQGILWMFWRSARRRDVRPCQNEGFSFRGGGTSGRGAWIVGRAGGRGGVVVSGGMAGGSVVVIAGDSSGFN